MQLQIQRGLPFRPVVVEQEVTLARPECQQVGVLSPYAQCQGFPGMKIRVLIYYTCTLDEH